MFGISPEYSESFMIIMYFLPALVSLIVLLFAKRKLIWLAIPITITADLITFWGAITYYETRGLAFLFLIPQIIVVSIISLVIMLVHKKRLRTR
ncbi:MAG: hypothetical protein FWD90_04205 [Defluviitaleaceae bacterium]|nr:hypothetical protein [Defluviitaleaceae bacterium]